MDFFEDDVTERRIMLVSRKGESYFSGKGVSVNFRPLMKDYVINLQFGREGEDLEVSLNARRVSMVQLAFDDVVEKFPYLQSYMNALLVEGYCSGLKCDYSSRQGYEETETILVSVVPGISSIK